MGVNDRRFFACPALIPHFLERPCLQGLSSHRSRDAPLPSRARSAGARRSRRVAASARGVDCLRGARGRVVSRSSRNAGRSRYFSHSVSVRAMPDFGGALGALVSETGFSGVIRIDQGDRLEFARAYGLAHRGFEIPNEVDTRFAIASGAKGFTALAVVSLIEEGVLELSTPARSVLGSDLSVIDDGVTVEHLLSHRSGIGDYLDEEAGFEVDEYVMPVPVHELATTEDYLAVLDGHASKFAPGERFAYCNAGYVVLALIAERASGVPFHELVLQRVCR